MHGFLSDENFEKFRNTIYNESGITFTFANRSILENRLKARLRQLKLARLDEYHRVIADDKTELQAFLDSVTTNLTRFFRNPAHVDAFEHYVLPQLLRVKDPDDRTVRVWSAGCSSGEEPYTVAMVMREILPRPFSIAVVATDISLSSLMIGREGCYDENQLKAVPERYLNKYFERCQSGYRIAEEIRRLVTFEYHNLKDDSRLRNQDVVLCRNVLLYFDKPAQRAVLKRFWDVMAPYSFLFIGSSESLLEIGSSLAFLKTSWAALYQKNIAVSAGTCPAEAAASAAADAAMKDAPAGADADGQ